MKRSLLVNLLLSFGLVLIVAGLGSLFVNLGMEWFNGLTTPTQWIPNIIIPIVWTVIYITASIIIFIWVSKENMPVSTIVLFVINGIFNVLWCLVFFTLHQTFLGLIVIILNLILGYWLIFDINKTKPIFAKILLIYSTWLSIATTLNLALWILN